MSEPALQLNVAFSHFPYAGNGSTSGEHPDIRRWELETYVKIKADNRIRHWTTKDFSDTPICMTRNRAIREAKAAGAHLLLMVDSDQSPDKHAGEAWFKPFWEEAFNFVYERYAKGLITVVGAPYCGPPTGIENVYVFQWTDHGNRDPHENVAVLEQYGRAQASIMSGIQECAALPTGMILLDLRAIDLIEPSKLTKREVLDKVRKKELSLDEGLRELTEGYCYYEWKDQFADEKASTEDVTFTRNISLACTKTKGYNPLFCAWDSWVGHHKPWNVGKPQRYTNEHINMAYQRAGETNASARDTIINLKMPEWARQLAEKQVTSRFKLSPIKVDALQPESPCTLTVTKPAEGNGHAATPAG